MLKDGTLASGSDDKSIIFWNVTSFVSRQIIANAHSDRVLAFEQTPEGYLVSSSASAAGDIKVWNKSTNGMRTLMYTLVNPFNSTGILCLKMINDTHLASGLQKTWTTAYGYIIIWNLVSRTQALVIGQHSNHVNVFELLSNGQLASGSNDNTVKIWSITNNVATKVHDFEPFNHNVYCLKQIRDGSLAIGGRETGVYFWNVSDSLLLAYEIDKYNNYVTQKPCLNFLYFNDSILVIANSNQQISLVKVTQISDDKNSVMTTLNHGGSNGIQWLESLSIQNRFFLYVTIRHFDGIDPK